MLAALGSLAGGCNAILGIDTHSLAPGTGGTSGTGGAIDISSCPADGSVPGTDGADGGATCGFIMPNPAYPATYASTSGNNDLTDSVTGLTWEADVDPSVDSQDQAARYCATKGGDWRLPTRLELASLLDVTVVNPNPYPPNPVPDPAMLLPMIDGAFAPTPATRFWSASHKKDSTSVGWYVGFDYGNSRQASATDSGRVRCVHGTPTRCQSPRYQIQDGTVHDGWTGLTWQRAYSQKQLAWSDAMAFCAANFGSDWRLPSVTELMTIVDETHESPSIDWAAFPCVPMDDSIDYFWTSSVYAGDPTWAYYVTFIHGHEDIEPGTTAYYARCVRWDGP
jgi:hypothetical protein